MSGSISSGIRAFFGVATVVFLAFALAGCGGDNGAGPKGGGDLILPTGEAWVACDVGGWDDEDGCNGIIFRSGGQAIGIWQDEFGNWHYEGSGEWSVSRDQLTLDFGYGERVTVTYSVSGSRLSATFREGPFSYTIDFTRTQVGTIVMPGGGGNVVLPDGYAWTDAHRYSAGSRDGIILHSNGTVTYIDDWRGYWDVAGTGTWSVSGNTLTVTGNGYVTGTSLYTVSSDGTILLWGFANLSRTQVGTLGGGTTGGGNVVLPDGYAWTDAHQYSVGNRGGFIFQSNGTVIFIGDDAGGTWWEDFSGTYTVSGNVLTISYLGDIETSTYSVSSNGDTLTIGLGWTLTRTQVGTLGSSTGGTNADLVNAAGEAWVDTYEAGNRDGFILHSNGTVTHVRDRSGPWQANGTGTWSVNGNSLTITRSGSSGYYYGTSSFTLSNNNNRLRWDGTDFNRINVGTLGGGTTGGGNVVLPDGWAWTDAHEYPADERGGFIFQENGTLVVIGDDADGTWWEDFSGTYTVNGDILTLIVLDDTVSLTYVVSSDGNTLTLGDILTLTRTQVGTLGGGGGGTNADLVNAAGEAWVDTYSAGNRDGFILHSNGTVTHIDDLFGSWQAYDVGTWSVSGTQLTITADDWGYYTGTSSFTLSNNNNSLRWDGTNFNRINIGTLSKALAADGAKVRDKTITNARTKWFSPSAASNAELRKADKTITNARTKWFSSKPQNLPKVRAQASESAPDGKPERAKKKGFRLMMQR